MKKTLKVSKEIIMIFKKLLLVCLYLMVGHTNIYANPCTIDNTMFIILPVDANDTTKGVVVLPLGNIKSDYDCDGIANSVDTDMDGDGVDNTSDVFPLDANETLDTDGDGIGNNEDTDDDGDGYSDSLEIAYGSDPLDAHSIPSGGVPPTASDFNMTLDVNASTATEEWNVSSMATDADGDTVTASVKTQGTYGTFVVTGNSLSYLKTSETNSTDIGVLEITDGIYTIKINVSVNSLYWKQVSGGINHTVALKSDGTVWAWGANPSGVLGNNTTIGSYIPVQEASGSTNWTLVSAGREHTVALKSDGTIWAWGNNYYDQIGDGASSGSRIVPTQEASSSTNWIDVNAGDYHTVAIKDDGTLWAWGSNYSGQLGDGTTTRRSIPTQEDSNSTNWTKASAGAAHTAALKSDGTLWAWGNNSYGQLGDGTNDASHVPVQEVTNSTNWDFVSIAKNHTVAIKDDGTLWAWGQNSYGQLGDGTTANKYVPTQEDSESINWESVNAGGSTNFGSTVAIKSDGTLWAWGRNERGQLGDGTTTNRTVPTQEYTKDTNWNLAYISEKHSLAIKDNGTLWTWGYNEYGEFGNGSDDRKKTVPTQDHFKNTYWSTISAGYSHTLAIKNDGTLWGWGDNASYKLGVATTGSNKIIVPIQESSLSSDWVSVSAGNSHSVALKTDGTLWSWGLNNYGQLGDGTNYHRSEPTQEDTNAIDWEAISAGGNFTVALKTNGTLWAWGKNHSGQLGDNTIVSKNVPTQEDTNSTNWDSVSAGYSHTLAIKNNGTLWAWGANTSGQLGDGTTTHRHIPTQENSNSTNWIQSSGGGEHSVALKSDGTIWAWGENAGGRLGDGTQVDKHVPTQEASNGTDWTSVHTGSNHSLALKSDGTLWAWGYNTVGQLGDGTTTGRYIPTQEDSNSTNWASVSVGGNHNIGIKDDNTIWAWGWNEYKQLGTDTITPIRTIERK